MGEVVASSEEVMEGMEAEADKEQGKKAMAAVVVEEEEEEATEDVKWEKLLPKMKLRVLLVEADDSTRQIIAALLRKCSYRVVAVSDGLMAWEALKSRPFNIDLILTELELPLISGYALLTLIMEHDICKNIPVIMMSSHDPISMVLKCMLKGAADFLIKPVRRNELRNLWQHVWRRQTLSAGPVIQNSSIAEEKIEVTSENKAASIHSSAVAAASRKDGESNEKDSDTQNLLELRCRNASNASNTDPMSYNEMVKSDGKSFSPKNETRERSNTLKKDGPSCCGTHNPDALSSKQEHASAKTSVQHEGMRAENNQGSYLSPPDHNNEQFECSSGAIDLIGTFGNAPSCGYWPPSLNDGINKSEFAPQLELSLRRFVANSSNAKNQGINERHGLNHSKASPFSWYNSSKSMEPFLSISSQDYKELDNTHKLTEQYPPLSAQNMSGKQHNARFTDGQEIATALVIGQSGKSQVLYPTPQIGSISVPRVRFNKDNSEYCHDVPPLHDAQSSLASCWNLKLASQAAQSPGPTSASVHSNHEILKSYEQNHRQSDEATNNFVDQHVYQQNNIEPGKGPRHSPPTARLSTSSSLCIGATNHDDGSAYGNSLTRNNGASSAAVFDKAMPADHLKDENLFIHGGQMDIDTNRSSHREAALKKFRLKRKDRCFEKKVRYQSRKRLAEQRPRVKGQFVRQSDALAFDANG